MVKPMKWTKTVTTGVLIASCITSTLPTQAFAMQANDYAEEFQAFVEGVENNKTDDTIADQAEQGTDQAAPVQPGAPAEQAAPAPQPTVPAASGETAPQGEPAAPVEDAQTGVSPSAGMTEVDGKSDIAKKDELAAGKVAGDKKEVAAEATDKGDGVEPAAEITAEVAPAEEIAEATAEKPQQTLGTFKELFPSESFRKVIRYNHIAWNDDDKLTREMLESVENLNILYGSGPFVVGAKDAESLGYMINLKSFGFYGDQDGVDSWSVQDMDKLWASIGKMKNLEMLTLSDIASRKVV